MGLAFSYYNTPGQNDPPFVDSNYFSIMYTYFSPYYKDLADEYFIEGICHRLGIKNERTPDNLWSAVYDSGKTI